MKIIAIARIGLLIWVLGVSIYALSYSIPLIEDAELQANCSLSLAVLPIVWFGTGWYFKKDSTTKGFFVGLAFFGIAAFLDALFTVPLLVLPVGGSYQAFFTAPGFWVIAAEFVLVASVYGYWFHRKKVASV